MYFVPATITVRAETTLNSVTDIARGLKIEHHFAFIQIHSIHIILKEKKKKKKKQNIIITMDQKCIALCCRKKKTQHVDSQVLQNRQSKEPRPRMYNQRYENSKQRIQVFNATRTIFFASGLQVDPLLSVLPVSSASLLKSTLRRWASLRSPTRD